MKVYLASSFENRALMPFIEEWFAAKLPSIDIVGRWWAMPKVENLQERAMLDFDAIKSADLLIAFYPYGYGTSAEMGFALGSDIPVIYFTPYSQLTDESMAPLAAGHDNCRVITGLNHLQDTLLRQPALPVLGPNRVGYQ